MFARFRVECLGTSSGKGNFPSGSTIQVQSVVLYGVKLLLCYWRKEAIEIRWAAVLSGGGDRRRAGAGILTMAVPSRPLSPTTACISSTDDFFFGIGSGTLLMKLGHVEIVPKGMPFFGLSLLVSGFPTVASGNSNRLARSILAILGGTSSHEGKKRHGVCCCFKGSTWRSRER